ncbi:hypothetical protein ABZX85_38265 [Streptomyces sp. NPDC004539]|uniref:hypothetical protein n=1 Tax=Streptomyces sp. NPDC004539 TaxID=3154280 RepID=UPI00339E7BB1
MRGESADERRERVEAAYLLHERHRVRVGGGDLLAVERPAVQRVRGEDEAPGDGDGRPQEVQKLHCRRV